MTSLSISFENLHTTYTYIHTAAADDSSLPEHKGCNVYRDTQAHLFKSQIETAIAVCLNP